VSLSDLDHLAAPIWSDFRDDATNQATRALLLTHYQVLADRAATTRARKARIEDEPFDRDDLAQELAIKLGDLLDSYDPAFNVPFSKYASPRLVGLAIDQVRNVKQSRTVFGARHGRPLQLAEAAGPHDKGDDWIEDKRPDPYAAAAADKAFRRELLAGITERRDRCFVLLRWYRGMSLAAIGRRWGLSESRMSQLQSRLVRVLMVAMDRPELAGARPAYVTHSKNRRKAA